MMILYFPRIAFLVTCTTERISGLQKPQSLQRPRCYRYSYGVSGTALHHRLPLTLQRNPSHNNARRCLYPTLCTPTSTIRTKYDSSSFGWSSSMMNECTRKNPTELMVHSPGGTDDETTVESSDCEAILQSTVNNHSQNSDSNPRKRTIYTIDYCAPTDPEKLQGIVQKYIDTLPQYLLNRPAVYHTQIAFTELKRQLFEQNLLDPEHHSMPIKPIILDSGCGTAKSTIRLGKQYPNALVFGIDRSLLRLTKNKFVTKEYIRQDDFRINKELREKFESALQQQPQQQLSNEIDDDTYGNSQPSIDDGDDDPTRLIEQVASNVWLIRAELIDFWRFLKQNSWNNKIQAHYMLYPNPYPKQSRLQLRWYAHASFPLCLQLLQPDTNYTTTLSDTSHPDGGVVRKMIVRSNWKQYLDEFEASAKMILYQQQQMQRSSSNVSNDIYNYSQLVVGETKEMIYPLTKEEMEQKAMTNFELKYWLVEEPTYELVISNQITS